MRNLEMGLDIVMRDLRQEIDDRWGWTDNAARVNYFRAYADLLWLKRELETERLNKLDWPHGMLESLQEKPEAACECSGCRREEGGL